MLFSDDETRDTYHKTVNATLQIVVQIFEARCAEYHAQVTLIDVIHPFKVLLGVPDVHVDALTEIECHINNRFPRRDQFATCSLDSMDLSTFVLYARGGNDFSNLS